MSTQQLHPYTINVLPDLHDAVQSLDGVHEDWAMAGQLRLWHCDGFSPGYFDLVDDFWVFVVDYMEASQAPEERPG